MIVALLPSVRLLREVMAEVSDAEQLITYLYRFPHF